MDSGSTAITIKIDDVPKGIMTIGIRKSSGDLIIKMTPAGRFRDSGTLIEEPGHTDSHGVSIKEQKYSIHNSKDSPSGIDTLMHTIELQNGQKIKTASYTKAFRTKTFCHLYSRIYPDLRLQRFSVVDKCRKAINIGHFDQNRFTLITSIFCGSVDSPYESALPSVDYNCISEIFGSYRMVLLWSFIHIFPQADGHLLHAMTMLPGETLLSDEQFNLRVNGVDHKSCINMFLFRRMVLKIIITQIIFKKSGLTLDKFPSLKLGFFKNGYK